MIIKPSFFHSCLLAAAAVATDAYTHLFFFISFFCAHVMKGISKVIPDAACINMYKILSNERYMLHIRNRWIIRSYNHSDMGQWKMFDIRIYG